MGRVKTLDISPEDTILVIRGRVSDVFCTVAGGITAWNPSRHCALLTDKLSGGKNPDFPSDIEENEWLPFQGPFHAYTVRVSSVLAEY